jgi:hypothetical protein
VALGYFAQLLGFSEALKFPRAVALGHFAQLLGFSEALKFPERWP